VEDTPVIEVSSFYGTLSRRLPLPRHLRTETDPVSETLRFLVSRIQHDELRPKNPVVLSVISHRQNPSEPSGDLLIYLLA
jgi:hypothetical protein